jgi:uncharacterized alpha-E superfamily protein
MSRERRPLLSRVADSIYWMARYIERAENVARYMAVNAQLQLDLPLEPAYQWQPLIDTSGDMDAFKERYGVATEESVTQFLAFDEKNLNSIYSCLHTARENARSVRETISSEMWEQVNSMYLRIQAQREAANRQEAFTEMLRSVRLDCHMFQGITDATMSHNEAWHFLRIGRDLERADKTSRILDVKYFILLPKVSSVGTPYDDLHWSAVLKSVSGFEAYRKVYGRISHRNIVELLVMDPEFPRSIRYCVTAAGESLRAITGSPVGSSQYESERQMAALESELDNTTADRIVDVTGLHEYLDCLQTQMNEVDNSLLQEFFIWRPVERAIGASS